MRTFERSGVRAATAVTSFSFDAGTRGCVPFHSYTGVPSRRTIETDELPPSPLAATNFARVFGDAACAGDSGTPVAASAAKAASSRLDDPTTDGVDGGLDPVRDLQLHQDVRDVVLDGLRADEQLRRDLGVVLALRDQLQHVELARGQLRRRRRRRGHRLLPDVRQEAAGDPGRDERVTGGGGADAGDQLLDRGALQEVAARARDD